MSLFLNSVPFIYLSIQELKPYYFNYGSMIMSTEIKTHNIKAVSFSFICGLTEDYNLGESLSDSSEELLRSGKGVSQHICDFGKGVCAIQHISW